MSEAAATRNETGNQPVSVFALILTLILGLQILNLQATTNGSENSGDYTTLNEVDAGRLLFRTGDIGQYQPAVLQSSLVDMTVSGLIAQVKLTQTFSNNTDQWQEGVYVFPLPDGAAVYQLKMKIGDRIIEGEIKEKQQAKKIYQQAKNSGKRASLVEQKRPNMFTTSMANIAPGDSISITLSYQQQVRFDQEQFSLRFPMTITPRYIPGTPLSSKVEPTNISINTGTGWGMSTTLVPDAERITPPSILDTARKEILNPVQVTVNLDTGMMLEQVTSPSHALSIKRQESLYKISLAGETVSMDRDFVLNWTPTTEATPKAALFTETRNIPSDNTSDKKSILLMLMPPKAQLSEVLPREMIFIIDTSGSMGGEPIRQARQALSMAVSRLTTQDRFNIIEFNSETSVLFSSPVAVTDNSKHLALSYIRTLNADGGTEMSSALDAALTRQGATPEGFLKQVVFITDGSVGNEEALFRQIQQQLPETLFATWLI